MKNEFKLQFVRNYKHLTDVLKFSLKNNQLSPSRFVIFGRGRSGSTALVSLINSLPNLHCDGEILNQPVLFPFSHVLAKCGNSNSSIYGCKILSYQIRSVQPILNREGFIRRLHDNGFKILYIKRENLIYHALSNIRAREFGFHKKVSEIHNDEKISVDTDELLNWIKSSEELDKYEKLLLEGIPHLSLTYENHLLNTGNHEPTVRLVCDYLSVECGKAETGYRKVSPKTLRDSVANYDEIIKCLENTAYAKYLD